jgi:hypothetical protein
MNNTITAEVWADIVGYEGYYSVSNWCRCRSETRTITHPGPWGLPVFTRTLRGKILRQKPNGEVTLSRGNIQKTVKVPQLAAAAFGDHSDITDEASVLFGITILAAVKAVAK